MSSLMISPSDLIRRCKKSKIEELRDREIESIEKRKVRLKEDIKVCLKKSKKFKFDEKIALLSQENKNFMNRIQKMKEESPTRTVKPVLKLSGLFSNKSKSGNVSQDIEEGIIY